MTRHQAINRAMGGSLVLLIPSMVVALDDDVSTAGRVYGTALSFTSTILSVLVIVLIALDRRAARRKRHDQKEDQ